MLSEPEVPRKSMQRSTKAVREATIWRRRGRKEHGFHRVGIVVVYDRRRAVRQLDQVYAHVWAITIASTPPALPGHHLSLSPRCGSARAWYPTLFTSWFDLRQYAICTGSLAIDWRRCSSNRKVSQKWPFVEVCLAQLPRPRGGRSARPLEPIAV